MDALSIIGLKKSFGDKKVLCGVDFSVPEHSVFGFIGKNGAGKTTTMRAVLGLNRPDSGEIYVMGERVAFGQTSTNRFVGYLPDVPEFYPYMNAEEYLALCGEIGGMSSAEIKSRSEELLKKVGLYGETSRIKGYSRGMKQRLGIAQALLHRPSLLICDEPTSALDPIGRKEILDIFLAAREETTILFSTHILSDVERICTDVAILNEGRIALKGEVSQLRRLHSSQEYIIETVSGEERNILLNAFDSIRSGDNGALIFSGDDDEFFRMMKYMGENKMHLQRAERIEPSLETLFLEVTE